MYLYVIVGSIPHVIAFGMYHVLCKGISHDYMVCLFAMWYAFPNQKKTPIWDN